jgi:hypothetical protein
MKKLKLILALSIGGLIGITSLATASENEWKCFYDTRDGKRYIEIYADDRYVAEKRAYEILSRKMRSLSYYNVRCYPDDYYERKYYRYDHYREHYHDDDYYEHHHDHYHGYYHDDDDHYEHHHHYDD